MNVYDQANVLAKGIRESAEYKILQRNKDLIEADGQLKNMFTGYRKQQFELQQMHMSGRQVPEDKVKELKKMHEIVVANQITKDFMEAEHRFAAMMADIHKILVDGLGLEQK
ncbi:YlbF family regulator [Phosphitispora fastidiosa]|uniref:YlbF family regulator n=1 Tax=Phosphitispora fastidiosa TaxID=2837202 RepID=UPI001E2C23E8|nr:cell fate (sporulation/competence/biofilm development) regulator YlbF (YheA/YmcA/DUF963 family) [Phosphitispora fastidiosa]